MPRADVNLFLNDPDDKHAAEIEVMIAEPKSRGKGLATEALQLLMSWAVVHLGIATYRCSVVVNAHAQAGGGSWARMSAVQLNICCWLAVDG